MRFLFKALIFLLIVGFVVFFAGYFYYSSGLPDVRNANKNSAKESIQVNFSNKTPIKIYGNLYNDKVKFYQVPVNLINAIVAIEDQNFFHHKGFDILAIIRAFYINQKSGRVVQGASTITQQLAKRLFLTPEKTIKRKIQELILANKLEKYFTKEQIFAMYLNHTYFGSGNYGITSAAKYYFGKKVSDLDLQESALLAGFLKAPSKLSSQKNRKLAQNRAQIVIQRMIDLGFVDQNDLDKIAKNNLSYKTNRLQKLYFSDFVHANLSDYIDKKHLEEGGVFVQTTLNKTIQSKLEDEINKISDANSKKLGKSQIAAIIMNKNGAILAMSGGKDYQKSQFNRAIYSKRQMGSAFKTFIYLLAFEQGATPDDIIEDKKVEFSNWLPNNYNSKYFGEVTLRQAFAKSMNSVSIQLAQKMKIKDIAKLSRKLGIMSKVKNNDLTIALGTTQATLYELTSAYASILNNSKPVIPYSITKITNSDNKVLFKRKSSDFPPVLSESSLKYGKEILREVVANGTAKNANVANNIYGKTGTSQNYRDAWFIGFNDDFVIGVWIGNDDNSPTNKITGGSLPAKLFAKIISRI